MKTFSYLILSFSLLAPQQVFCKTKEKKASVVTNSVVKKLGVFTAVACVIGATAWKLHQSHNDRTGIALSCDSDGDDDNHEDHGYRLPSRPQSQDLSDHEYPKSPTAPKKQPQGLQDPSADGSNPKADDERDVASSVKTAETIEAQGDRQGPLGSDDEETLAPFFDQL